MVNLEAASEAAARLALGRLLTGWAGAGSDDPIETARSAERVRRSGQRGGRPPIARRQVADMLALLEDGVSVVDVAGALGVHPCSVYRAVKWAAERG